MTKPGHLFLIFLSVVCTSVVYAQGNANYKFGKIAVADFALNADKFDSGANVLIIADIGNTRFEGNNQGSFNYVYTRFMRIKIMNKNGFDIGNQEISLYHDLGDIEKMTSLKASTYNLENGVINETKLDDKSVFSVKYNSNIDDKKFAMPALKEGAIFEIEYTIKSPYVFRMKPWTFQGENPVLWSEYTVTIPPPLHYVVRVQGDQHFMIDTTKEVFLNYTVRSSNGTAADENYSINGSSIYRRWVKSNVPSLHEEPYTTTIKNYYSRVTFQLEYVQWSKDSEKHFQSSTWNLLSKTLLADEDFGLSLESPNNWMVDEVKNMTQGANTETEKTEKIFDYIRDHFKCDGERGLYKKASFKEIFKKKTGNVADINLLLTAFLINAGINTEPLILSTRDHGMADPSFPLSIEYNYVICVAFVGGRLVTLDASRPFLKFGELPVSCYNGFGHTINLNMPKPVYFTADSLRESSLTRVIIFNDEKGQSSGGFVYNPGKYETYSLRSEISGSSIKAQEKKTKDENEAEYTIENFGIDSLEKYDFPITLHFDFKPKRLAKADILYFNPMMSEGYKSNPFKDAHRQYPVEMPYQIDETYILSMDIPAGYQVDELPKSARIAYNETEGMFEYLIQNSGDNIELRVSLRLNKSFFPTDEYSTLRDFFAAVVKKEGEQIVFKKK